MKTNRKFFPAMQVLSIFILLQTFTSCEEPIDVEIDEGETVLVVDGWITDEPGPHQVILSTSSPYFENNTTPRKTGAQVRITDNSGIIEILEETAPGIYATGRDFRALVGRKYHLSIEVDDQFFEAETEIRRPAQIDSLKTVYKKKSMMNKEGFYVEYYGPEAAGIGDHYRFRIYRNDQLLNKPQDLVVLQDRMMDGLYFRNVQFHSEPFEAGDRVNIEAWSITEDAYYFYDEMRDQIMNGGLFANPVANIRTNIKPAAENSMKAVGYFGGASVVSMEILIE